MPLFKKRNVTWRIKTFLWMTTMSNLLCDLNFVFDALCAQIVHKSALASTRIRLHSFHFPDVEGSSPIIGATQYESRAAGGLAPPAGCPFFFFSFFLFIPSPPTFSAANFLPIARFQSLPALAVYLTVTGQPPPSLPPSYQPPPVPLSPTRWLWC